jgi:hypothetical protein
LGYDVSGAVDVRQRSIILNGLAPTVDSRCNIINYRNDVLVFSFNGCGCECGDHPELSAIYPPPPNLTGATASTDAASCPYLYAWDDQNSQWHSYGKVIRDARGQHLERIETIELSSFSTRFRLAEKEPEQSFIDHVELRVTLKDGSQVILRPTPAILVKRDRKRLQIPAFGSVEFTFRAPPWITRDLVERTLLSITGYYEEIADARICRRPVAASEK